MLYYDKAGFSEQIDVNKTCESKECNICHYRYFLDKGFMTQPDICNGCHDLTIKSMNLSDMAVLNIKAAIYCCIISRISKSETLSLL